MMKDDQERELLVAKIRRRIDTCRSLARSTTDPNVVATLNAMADEGEADIVKFLSDKPGK